MAKNDTFLAIENAVEQLEQAPAVVQETHKLKHLGTEFRRMSTRLKELDGQELEPDVAKWLKQLRDVAYKTQEVVGSIVAETNHQNQKSKLDGQEIEQDAAKWLKQVRNVAYKTQEVVGSIVAETDHQNQKSKLGRLLSGSRVTKHHLEIEGIEKCIVDINAASSNKEPHHRHRSISFKIDEVVGFKDAQETLVRKLISDAKSQCEVLLIHGKAGSGKTTLAKMVSNDGRIKEHFGDPEWMYFPRELPLEEFLCRILKQTSSPSNQTDCLSKDELKARFCESLKGKRYLAAIDDVHNDDELDELMSLFPDESNGSRILLASRVPQSDLRVQKSFSFSYEVRPLDVNHSWQLLSRKVREGEIHPDLELLGTRMAANCKGSPRAIVAMAAILDCAEKTEQMWSKFLEGYDDISKYKDLLPKEQLCLLYFGLFPEGVHISAKQMIQMWMAEGLLKQTSSKEAEEIGKDYLQKLIDQSFIQIHTKKADESVKTCHAFRHISHLCISQGAAEKFFVVRMNNTKPQEDIKRMAIHSDSVTDVLKSYGDCSAHSLHCFGNSTSIRSADLWKTLLHNFHHLWVLNLGFLELDKVPKELGKLTDLRYLRLKAPNAKHLPSSIVNLHKLETLDMRESRHLVSLPHGIWKMQFLRHLYFGGSTSLPQTSGIDYYRSLPNLQTLSGVKTDKILKWLMVRAKFPNVRNLRICSVNPDLTFNFLNSLDHLYHLQSLRVENPTKLPDLNAFPLSLTKLTLLKTELPTKSIKTLEKLPYLRILKLLQEAICGEKIVCSKGGFLQLEVLYIEEMIVKKWELGEGAMQCVKRFFMKKCNGDILETAPDYLRRVANTIEGNGTQ